eukprot:COSAG02_NODE_1472_length_12451_cov_183.797037_2_plen_98_part_00
MPDLFTRCGGRQHLVKMEKFLHFFGRGTGPFEMRLPTLVECIAAHKIPFVATLAKRSHDGKTVPTTAFIQVLHEGFRPGDVTEKDWDELRYIADPFR